MKKLLIAALSLGLCACDDPKTAKRAAENAGLSDVETLGYSIFGCSKDDNFATRFSAKNAKGYTVTGVVCSGWLKGATVRFD